MTIMQLEGLVQLEKINYPIETRTRNYLPAYNIPPQTTTLYRAPFRSMPVGAVENCEKSVRTARFRVDIEFRISWI
jgi:hypothetical protein